MEHGPERQYLKVHARVTAEDIVASLEPAELAELELMAAHFGLESVADEATAEALVRALIEPPLDPGDAETWFGPYREAGCAGWEGLVRRLRVSSSAEFMRVVDLEFCTEAWRESFSYFERLPVVDPEEAMPLPLYTLGVVVALPADPKAPAPPPDNVPVAVRPYPADDRDAAAVRDLADHLAPRILGLPNGEARMNLEPVRDPLCAMVATVWNVCQDRQCRTRHQPPRYRPAFIEACLDALALGQHRETARRILLRTHPQHIHIDVVDLARPLVEAEWDSLGLFARADDGNYSLVLPGERRRYRPRLLLSLTGPDPL